MRQRVRYGSRSPLGNAPSPVRAMPMVPPAPLEHVARSIPHASARYDPRAQGPAGRWPRYGWRVARKVGTALLRPLPAHARVSGGVAGPDVPAAAAALAL